MITSFINDYLENQSVITLLVLADYIDESSNPEVKYYSPILRTAINKPVTLQFLIDCVMKFGSNKEKKYIGKNIRKFRGNGYMKVNKNFFKRAIREYMPIWLTKINKLFEMPTAN